MKTDIQHLSDLATDAARDARRLPTIINYDWFLHIYNVANPSEKRRIDELIKTCQVEKLMSLRHKTPLDFYLFKDLRSLAKKLKIYNYSRLTRGELIAEIVKNGSN